MRSKRGQHRYVEILSDSQKFAREKYLMKKDNEDIYLIVEEKEEKKVKSLITNYKYPISNFQRH